MHARCFREMPELDVLLFYLFIWFRFIPGCAQGLFLTLCSGISSCNVLGILRVSGIKVGLAMYKQHSLQGTISLTLHFIFEMILRILTEDMHTGGVHCENSVHCSEPQFLPMSSGDKDKICPNAMH